MRYESLGLLLASTRFGLFADWNILMSNELSRRQFLTGATAFALGSAVFGLPRRAFADDAQAGSAIVILHTNDVHCAVGEADEKGATPLGYSALASYVADRKGVFGDGNVTLVDAGDAVQGNVMGTLTQGQALVDIMNATGYDYVIPGNHEFDYGMPQFNHLAGSANATYLSCNFTDKRPEVPTLMFAPYAIQDYPLAGSGNARVAFVGVTTPATLTASSPKSFWRSDDDHTCVYGFCEDDTGAALAAAVQNAVNQARAAGADYVVLLAHLGQDGSPDIWRSDALAKRCRGIDVIIDGHSHQEYVQVKQDAEGKNVIITQTGTQFSSVGQVVINPDSGTISASTPAFEATLLREARKSGDPAYVQETTFGRDASVQDAINKKVADVEAQTGTVIGKSEVNLYAFEDDNYTWAVRAHETNLGDFVCDAYLYYATNAGVMADIAFVNGGGVRANLNSGNVTKGNLINVNPFNNQLCYTSVSGQDLLDALELSGKQLARVQRRLSPDFGGAGVRYPHRHRLACFALGQHVRRHRRREGAPRAQSEAARQGYRPASGIHAGMPLVLPGGRRRFVQHAVQEPGHAAGLGQRCPYGIRAAEPARRYRAGICRRRRSGAHRDAGGT